MAQSPDPRGDVVKWFNTEVCKTSIHRFESGRRLQFPPLRNRRRCRASNAHDDSHRPHGPDPSPPGCPRSGGRLARRRGGLRRDSAGSGDARGVRLAVCNARCDGVADAKSNEGRCRVAAAVAAAVAVAVAIRASLWPAGRTTLVDRLLLERTAPERYPAFAPDPACPRPKPVPSLGRHVGRVGGVQPGRVGVPLPRQADGGRYRRRTPRGDQLRGLPRPPSPLRLGRGRR